jgi:hypothetical protein
MTGKRDVVSPGASAPTGGMYENFSVPYSADMF